MNNWLYSELSSEILSAYFRVYYDLVHRRGYSEANLVKALVIELEQRELSVETEVSISQSYQGEDIGTDFVDLVVNDRIAVEVKNVRRIEQRHTDQLRVYLHDGGWPVGLLLNFGGKEPYHRRLYEPRHDPEKQRNA
jgi:GxxExxY protein